MSSGYYQFTNDFLGQIEHQMTVFKGQLGTNLSTIPFHFKNHWDMKLGTRPRAAGTNTSPENCVGIYGDKYCLPSHHSAVLSQIIRAIQIVGTKEWYFIFVFCYFSKSEYIRYSVFTTISKPKYVWYFCIRGLNYS